jgi:hypothetical protein
MSRTHNAKTLTISIDRPPADVYAFVSDVANFPKWATSFVKSARKTADGWVVETTEGPMGFEYAPKNEFGVLDHVVRPAPHVAVHVPMRVVPNGGGSEVIFTLVQFPGMPAEKFERDIGMVTRDLATLKHLLES